MGFLITSSRYFFFLFFLILFRTVMHVTCKSAAFVNYGWGSVVFFFFLNVVIVVVGCWWNNNAGESFLTLEHLHYLMKEDHSQFRLSDMLMAFLLSTNWIAFFFDCKSLANYSVGYTEWWRLRATTPWST